MRPLLDLARRRGENVPLRLRGNLDGDLVRMNQASVHFLPEAPASSAAAVHRLNFARAWAADNLRLAAEAWRAAALAPVNRLELASAGEALAEVGDPAAAGYAERLAPLQPAEAAAIKARLAWRQGEKKSAAEFLLQAFRSVRTPWSNEKLMGRSLVLAAEVANADRMQVPRLYDALRRPFPASQLDETRRLTLLSLSYAGNGCGPRTIEILRSFEPNPFWTEERLRVRAACYQRAGLEDLALIAKEDWLRFKAAEPEALVEEGVRPLSGSRATTRSMIPPR